MIEYLLIDGVNDREEDADALAAFCADRNAAAARVTPPLSRKEARAAAGYVNLIPFNPTEAGDAHGYKTPSDAAVGAAACHSMPTALHVFACAHWRSVVAVGATVWNSTPTALHTWCFAQPTWPKSGAHSSLAHLRHSGRPERSW